MKYKLNFLTSFLNLLWERVWSAFWAAFAVAALYASLCLFGLPGLMNGDAQGLLLAAFVLAFIYAAGRYGRGFKFPASSDVERKMEEASGLRHRPLAALRDRPAEGLGAESASLWNAHLRRIGRLRNSIRSYRARPTAARQDKYRLRYVALLLLAAGIFTAREQAWPRLLHGFTPDVVIAVAEEKTDLDAWITPPEYTHQAPVFLASSQGGAAVAQGDVAVPGGSVLKVRVSGGFFPPRLRYADRLYSFTKADGQNYITEIPVGQSGRLRIRQGFRTLGGWKITAAEDKAPEIAIVSTGQTPRAALKINYTASDDYGVTKLTGTVTPPDGTPPGAESRVETFDMLPPDNAKADDSFTVDLTSNIRAGSPALLTLTAVDSAGHIVSTPPFSFTLPERKFKNPLAQRLIADRKKLVTMHDPLSLRVIVNDLSDVGSRPGLYKGDITVFMALGSCVRRLVYHPTPEEISGVRDILWDVALKLEDGGLSVAARELSDALQKLSQALNDKTLTKSQIQALIDEAQKKMQQYLQALANEMAQHQGAQKLPPEIAQQIMKRIDMSALMQQLREMAQKDPQAALQKMAEFLKNAVDNMDPAKMEQMRQQQAQQMQALQDLQDIIRGQQSLMDKTARLDPDAKGADESKQQDGLRAKLGDIARKMGDMMPSLPDNIARADQAMKQSQGAFKAGSPKDSVPYQKAAIDELQKGLDDALQKIADGMQQTMLSMGMMPQGSGSGEGYDPLGREDGSGKAGGDIKLPDRQEQRRVQEIIQELRTRSNSYQRPKVERDYIDRLLDQMN